MNTVDLARRKEAMHALNPFAPGAGRQPKELVGREQELEIMDRIIAKNPDRLICIYIIIYQEVTFTTNRVSFYNLILYLLKNNVFSLSLYPFAFTPFTSLLPFFTILAFPSSYIQANDDAGH